MDYLTEFDILQRAGVGVIVTPTREPRRVVEELKHYAAAMNEETKDDEDEEPFIFKDWNNLRGWKETPLEESALRNQDQPGDGEEPFDNETDVYTAMTLIDDQPSGNSPWPKGIFVMEYTHHWMNDPLVLQLIKELCYSLTEDTGSEKGKLVLTVPDTFTLPKEIEEDVTLLEFIPPVQATLERSFSKIMSDMEEEPYEQDQIERIATAGLGMTLAEFEKTVARAIIVHDDTFPETDIDDFVQEIMNAKVEVVKKSAVLEVLDTMPMDQIGGLENVKDWITERKQNFTPEAREFGIDPPKGILEVGIPGTGKSVLPMAIASELGIPLIEFNIGAGLGSYVGESEKKTEAALKYLESMAPCVCFVDEIDKAGFKQSSGGGGDNGVSDRILRLFLKYMAKDNGIFWTFAANRAEGIPTELTRKGRIDETFGLTFPTADERREVIKIHLRKRKQDPDEFPNLEAAVTASEGYVPAEIEVAVNATLIRAFNSGKKVGGKTFSEVIGKMKPMRDTHRADVEAMRLWCEVNAVPASKGTANFKPASTGKRTIKRGTPRTR